jgi:hypothetical protein
MFNTESAYIESGYKCARARLESDEARARHWREYFSKMRSSEKTEADQAEARRLFDQGYTEAQPARRTWLR